MNKVSLFICKHDKVKKWEMIDNIDFFGYKHDNNLTGNIILVLGYFNIKVRVFFS